MPTRAASVLLTAGFVMSAVGCSDAGETPAIPSSTVITSTTAIAGAGVLGNQRRPDESCAPEPARLDSTAERRRVGSGTERGDVDVPGDPQRIVALSGDQLDALCALGLQSRVVAAALPEPPAGQDATQPSYLGTVIHDLPGVGPRSAPDRQDIAAAEPDLILGSSALTPDFYGELTAIAPTVFTGPGGADWQDTVRQVGAATGRAEAAEELLRGFDDDAEQTGLAGDATHFQASVVQLTENSARVFGVHNFPGSVLAAVGADRPASQRFADEPFLEIDTEDLGSADFSPVDADIVYVSFASPAAKERAATVFTSDAWRALSATRDNRVLVVNNEIWQTGQGLVAARGILDDVRFINAPIN